MQPMATTDPSIAHTRIPDTAVLAHFHASAELYRSWSHAGHLHFGYWRWPLSPLGRPAMLDELVHHVIRGLRPLPGQRYADLGCGYGSAARLAAGSCSISVDAFTVIPEQVAEGSRLAALERVPVHMHLKDFRCTGLPDASMDAVYAIESLCYGSGPSKHDVLHEAARILKPGARLAVVDGFLLKRPRGMRGDLVETVEQGWALPCFPERGPFLEALSNCGFRNIHVEDLSFRIAPCAFHGLPLMLRTLFERWYSRKPISRLESAHLRSCMLGILLGTQLDLFRYCLITAEKA